LVFEKKFNLCKNIATFKCIISGVSLKKGFLTNPVKYNLKSEKKYKFSISDGKFNTQISSVKTAIKLCFSRFIKEAQKSAFEPFVSSVYKE
jgi:hypothetical protein